MARAFPLELFEMLTCFIKRLSERGDVIFELGGLFKREVLTKEHLGEPFPS